MLPLNAAKSTYVAKSIAHGKYVKYIEDVTICL